MLPASTTEALTAEASHRQFYRQSAADGTTVIVMDSPPTLERNQAFTDLAALFHGAGLPVPQVLAMDLDAGYLLLSDVGSRDLYTAYAQGQTEPALAAAIGWLHRLQPIRSPLVPLYTTQRLKDELNIFSEWFVQGALGLPDCTANLADCFADLILRADAQKKVCVHRDYHCRNLLFDSHSQLGIVDFQDALHGPLTYDLASLLYDCYYRLSPSVVAHWREQFRLRAAPHINAAAFIQDCDWMALQRQIKAIGIFVRLAQRDNKNSHLRHVGPTLQQATTIAGHYPALASLHQALLQHETLWPAAQLRLQQAFDQSSAET